MPQASDYGDLYQSAGQRYNVDPKLLQAIVATESGGDPNAVSSAGAQGAAQLMPPTAQALGVTDPNNPQQAIYGAAKLLDENLKRYGSADQAILAYHGGTDQSNWGPKTKAYLQKVKAAYQGQKMPVAAQDNSDAFSAAFSPSGSGAPSNDNDAFSAAFGEGKPVSQPKGSAITIKPGPGDTSNPGLNLRAPTAAEFAADDAALTAKNASQQPAAPAPEGSNTGLINGARNFAISALPGVGIPLMAGAQALKNTVGDVLNGMPVTEIGGDLSNTYQQAKDIYQGNRLQYQQAHPVEAAATSLGGNLLATVPAMALGGELIAPLVSAGSKLVPAAVQGNRLVQYGSKIANAATQGATANMLVSGDTGQSLPEAAEQGALIGGGLAAGAPVLARGLQAGANLVRAPFSGSGTVASRIINKFGNGAPAIVNGSEIVAGSSPTLAEATGNPNVAGLQRTLRDINPGPFVAREQQNAAARNSLFHGAAGAPQDIEAATAAREAAATPKRQAALSSASDANPAYVNRAINRILASPSGQRDVVSNVLKDVQNKLFVQNPLADRISRALDPIKTQLANGGMSSTRQADFEEARRLLNSAARGNTSEEDLVKGLSKLAKDQKIVGPIDNALKAIKEGDTKFQSDAAQLYGIRQSITDRLSPLAAGTGSDARLAARELSVIKKGLDGAIEKAAPGFRDYLKTYSEMSRPIDQMKFLQGLNLFDAQGNITLQKVQTALRNVQKLQGAKGVNAAKSLTPDQVNVLTAIRDDLLRAQNTSLGKSIGSPTVQNAINQLGLGKAAVYAGKAIPAAVATVAGGLMGHIAGSPEIGAALGYPVGHVIGNAMGARSEAVRQEIENLLLNPSALKAAQPGRIATGIGNGWNYLSEHSAPYALPFSVLGINRLTAPAAQNVP